MEQKVCLIGKGTVGSSLLKLLIEKRKEIKDKFGIAYKFVAIFEFDGALIDEEGLDIEQIDQMGVNFRNSKSWKLGIKILDHITQLDLDIIVETTPTNPETGEPALSTIVGALSNNINVVASNKGPFYLQYQKIKDLAQENGCQVRYEGTVASCVPILSMREALVGNTITGIRAILNGTCNYILSRMSAEGVQFDVALKEAQELGYAEADPTLDIEGYDAAGKLVILANELLGWSKTIKDVQIKGITNITAHSIDLAKTEGYVIKHLAITENDKLVVEPRLVEINNPLNISGTLNVIELQTKHAGPIILMGRGAGGFEAASAVLNDMINISLNY
ncbi:MAG: homoserine dehydrogenase [Candidatus Lokiarchaeota archaeon]|nr:homoserine dehydrogenase [Candidatus Lokiarchaeota archaeon]